MWFEIAIKNLFYCHSLFCTHIRFSICKCIFIVEKVSKFLKNFSCETKNIYISVGQQKRIIFRLVLCKIGY